MGIAVTRYHETCLRTDTAPHMARLLMELIHAKRLSPRARSRGLTKSLSRKNHNMRKRNR